MTTKHGLGLLLLLFAVLAAPQAARAELDLSRAQVDPPRQWPHRHPARGAHLPAGQRPVDLPQRRARRAGRTGLAHFVEHLAFRGSAAFPNGAATDAIYDAGGEWHGYTWLDQTAYFATVPSDRLDLLLAIEADRMARVEIDDAAVEAERGAVLAERHSYENDPGSVLFDAVAAAAFGNHPYRTNTIGSESDVTALTAGQAGAFYEAHYVPANAVLAIAGDIDPAAAMALVRRHFGALPARPAPARAAAVEPARRGERRITIAGAVERRHFEFAYPAPAASSPDFAAFLVLQQLLSGGSGVNFRQNDWGTPAVLGSALHGAADDIASWFIPTADPYLLTITGSLPTEADRAALEAELERRIARLSEAPPPAPRLAAAKAAVAEQLIFDLETNEDAAHQLAFFEGLGASDVLLGLPEAVRAVTPADVRRVARAHLAPRMRTVGWYVPAEPVPAGPDPPRNGEGDRPAQPDGGGGPPPSQILSERVPGRGTAPRSGGAEGLPQLRQLSGGLPAIVQPSPLSPTATVTLLLTAPVAGEEAPSDLPGLGAVARSGLATDLPELIAAARAALTAGPAAPDTTPTDDPETRLEQMIAAGIGATSAARPAPIVAIVSGAVDPEAAFAALERAFGSLAPAAPPRIATASQPTAEPGLRTVTARIDRPRAQGMLGYVVKAPPPATREGLAWRMLLYILTHDYGGRLGDEAIRDRGLIYHIESAYRTDGPRGWITLATGVDPARLDAMEAALRAGLARLAADPPTETEVAAARSHLIGRDLSAAQSNSELAARLARMFVETGGLRAHSALAAALESIGPADLGAAASAFAGGTILRIEVGAGGAAE